MKTNIRNSKDFAKTVLVTKTVSGQYVLWVSLTGDPRMDMSSMGNGDTVAEAFQHPIWLRYVAKNGAPKVVVHDF